MTDLAGLIERLGAGDIMEPLAARERFGPSFGVDQELVTAVEERTERPRVTAAEAIAYAEGFRAALRALQATGRGE